MGFIPVALIVALYYAAIAPWRWMWRTCALVFLLGTMLLFALDDTSMRGPGAAIGAFMFLLVLAPAMLVLTIRLAWTALRTIQRRDQYGNALHVAAGHPHIQAFDLVLLAVAGALVAGVCVVMLGTSFKSVGLSYLGHGLGGILGVSAVAAHAYTWLRGAPPAGRRLRTFRLSAAFVTAVVSLSGAFYPELVMKEAAAKAAGYPYCIAMNVSRRPVLSVQDMTLFGFDTGGLRHHAVLLVDRNGEIEPHHWSYRRSTFQPGVWFWEEGEDHRSRVDCRPEKDFVERLPIMSQPKIGHEWAYVDGRLLEIPTIYEPVIFLGDIRIAAIPPSFAPAPDLPDEDRVQSARRDHIWLEHFADEAIASPPDNQVDDLQEVRVAEHDGPLYYRLDDRGNVETFVTCRDDGLEETACWHRFYRHGRMYSFKHGQGLIEQSTGMEQALFDLFASFDVQP